LRRIPQEEGIPALYKVFRNWLFKFHTVQWIEVLFSIKRVYYQRYSPLITGQYNLSSMSRFWNFSETKQHNHTSQYFFAK
jgi:hypothetical protein